ncbi:MAG: hypothetical protein IJW59_03935 [Clostridia bacterium]|nr:hypothetical protein [Clostridia bacterium]
MYTLSEIISSPVISLFECEYQGTITNLLFDSKLKKCKYACVVNESDGIAKTIKTSDFYIVGKNCTFIKNESYVDLNIDNSPYQNNCTSIIHLNVFDTDGNYYGVSKDINLDENFNILNIVLDNDKIISEKEICNIGKTIILLNKNNFNLNKFKPKQKIKINSNTNTKVVVLNEKKPSTLTHKPNNPINKITTDSRFLFGRKLNKTIVSSNGEIIAKSGSIITKNILSKASIYGKTLELTRFSS